MLNSLKTDGQTQTRLLVYTTTLYKDSAIHTSVKDLQSTKRFADAMKFFCGKIIKRSKTVKIINMSFPIFQVCISIHKY